MVEGRTLFSRKASDRVSRRVSGSRKGKERMAEKESKLKITYEIDGEIIKIVERDITKKEKWFWLGNSIWGGY